MIIIVKKINFTFHFNRNSVKIFNGDDCDDDDGDGDGDDDGDDVSYLVGKLIFST
jgi:hypothetical protein